MTLFVFAMVCHGELVYLQAAARTPHVFLPRRDQLRRRSWGPVRWSRCSNLFSGFWNFPSACGLRFPRPSRPRARSDVIPLHRAPLACPRGPAGFAFLLGVVLTIDRLPVLVSAQWYWYSGLLVRGAGRGCGFAPCRPSAASARRPASGGRPNVLRPRAGTASLPAALIVFGFFPHSRGG